MAAYPSLVVARSTRVVPKMQTRFDVMADGTPRGVATHSVESYDIQIDHELLTTAEIATLEAFWATNKFVSWTFTWNGTTYNCLFVAKPNSWNPDGINWSAQTRAVGTQVGGG